MKKFLACLAMMLTTLSVHATTFTEGDYYTVIDQPKAKTPTVTEYFSFYCPHCFQFESIVKNLKPALADDVTFEKVHVGFMGGAMGESMMKAYATMVELQVQDKLVPKMFEQIHISQQPPRNDKELRQWFIDNGVSGNAFDLAFQSQAVQNKVNEYNQRFTDSTLRGVPGIVVNDKYIVVASKVRSYDEYNKLVNYLLTL